MFKEEEEIEDDIVELRDIGEYINGLNRMKLVGRDQLKKRRELNVEYMRHYKWMVGFRPDEVIELEHPLKLKSTNHLTHAKRQKPTKSKFTKSKRNSARTRKNKRKSRYSKLNAMYNPWVNSPNLSPIQENTPPNRD